MRVGQQDLHFSNGGYCINHSTLGEKTGALIERSLCYNSDPMTD